MRGPRVLLALCGLGLALVLGETVARVGGGRYCADEPGELYEEDAALGWRQRANLVGWVAFCKGKPVPPTPLETDARGFRNPGRPLAKPPGTARILLLGGNLPQAMGVDWPLSLAGMLEGRADLRAGRPLEVVNGAMGSFALDQDLVLLRQEGARVAPDLVLAFVDATVETAALSPALIGLRGMRAPAKPYFDVVGGALVPLALPEPDPAPPSPPAEATGVFAASRLLALVRGVPPSRGAPPRWLPASVTTGATDPDEARRHGDRVLEAVLAALRDESAALGARFVLVAGPPATRPRFGEESPTQHLLAIAKELEIPSTSLTLPFWGFEEATGRRGLIADTTRLDADGHFVASHVIWSFLEQERLLPAGVVGIRAPGGGRTAPLDPFPGALLAQVWMQRTGPVVRVALAGLAGVCLLWVAAPLPAGARDWVAVATSLGVLGIVVGSRAALAALGFVLALFLVVEIRWTWVRRSLLAVLAMALVVGPLAWLARLSTEDSVPLRPYVGLAGAMTLLRGLDYARARRQEGAGRPRLVDYLLGLLFFPTLATGPIQTVDELAAARGPGGLAPDTGAALAHHVGAAARGLVRLAWGTGKLLVVLACLNLVTPDVLASGGSAVGRGRLWLWTFETTLYLWALYGGWSDVGIGTAAMAGVGVPENFRAPWRASSPGDFWRRSYVTVTQRLRRLAGAPVAARFGTAAGVVATAAAGALWYAWMVLVLYGVFGSRPAAWLGLALWAIVQAAGVRAFARPESRDRGAVGRTLAAAATQLFFALGWTLLLAFPRTPATAIVGIYARLAGLR